MAARRDRAAFILVSACCGLVCAINFCVYFVMSTPTQRPKYFALDILLSAAVLLGKSRLESQFTKIYTELEQNFINGKFQSKTLSTYLSERKLGIVLYVLLKLPENLENLMILVNTYGREHTIWYKHRLLFLDLLSQITKCIYRLHLLRIGKIKSAFSFAIPEGLSEEETLNLYANEMTKPVRCIDKDACKTICREGKCVITSIMNAVNQIFLEDPTAINNLPNVLNQILAMNDFPGIPYNGEDLQFFIERLRRTDIYKCWDVARIDEGVFGTPPQRPVPRIPNDPLAGGRRKVKQKASKPKNTKNANLRT